MLDKLDFDEATQAWVLGVLYMLYEKGIRNVHMGGLMRVLGVSNLVAAEFDEKVFTVNEDFAKYIRDMQSLDNPCEYLH